MTVYNLTSWLRDRGHGPFGVVRELKALWCGQRGSLCLCPTIAQLSMAGFAWQDTPRSKALTDLIMSDDLHVGACCRSWDHTAMLDPDFEQEWEEIVATSGRRSLPTHGILRQRIRITMVLKSGSSFTLSSECRAEYDTGCYSSFTDGSVHWNAANGRSTQLLLEWASSGGDAADIDLPTDGSDDDGAFSTSFVANPASLYDTEVKGCLTVHKGRPIPTDFVALFSCMAAAATMSPGCHPFEETMSDGIIKEIGDLIGDNHNGNNHYKTLELRKMVDARTAKLDGPF